MPHFKRGEKTLEFLYSAMAALKSLNIRFISLTEKINYKLTFSAQTIYLEHTLNDLHDPITRGIYIETEPPIDFIHLFNNAELKPETYLFNNAESSPVYIGNFIEYGSQNHFTVFYPIALPFNEIAQRKTIDQYNLAFKKYQFQSY